MKEDQKELYQNLVQSFDCQRITDTHAQPDVGHGRIEKRLCDIITQPQWVESSQWGDLTTLVRVNSERTDKLTGRTQQQTRYYISSRAASAATFNQQVRSHWAIENKLHWVMDVTFHEDASRKRMDNSAYNFNIISKMALKVLEKNKGKLSKPLARMKAAYDDVVRSLLIKDF